MGSGTRPVQTNIIYKILDPFFYYTQETGGIDDDLLPGSGREEEGGHHQQHRDQAGQDDGTSEHSHPILIPFIPLGPLS